MYSGIVQACVAITEVKHTAQGLQYALILPGDLLSDLTLGASIAVDGVCQTVISIDPITNRVAFDAIPDTLDITTLGTLKPGRLVHVERSLRVGEENGGHFLSGHVSGCAKLIDVNTNGDRHQLSLEMPQNLSGYLIEKGFIALDGVSLTLQSVDAEHGRFQVSLIPETLRRTHFGDKKIGDLLNVEIDAQTKTIVDTIIRLLPRYSSLL